jgi:hypothetical protein
MINSKLLIGTILLGAIFVTASCNKFDPDQPGLSSARLSFQEKDPKQARKAFAETLAKALEKKEVRDFLKARALEQFDEDYDVFFHAEKNRKVAGDTTFFELLASYHGSKKDFVDITQSLPKLTILVPELFNEQYYNSALTWDTEHFVPKVAAFDVNEKESTVDAYDAKGNKHKLDRRKDPNELVLVVKDNERIEVTEAGMSVSEAGTNVSAETSNNSAKKAQLDYFMTDNGRNYYFSSVNFNRAKSRKSNRNARMQATGTDFNVGSNSPEYRSHLYRPEAPRGYAYYKTYYSNGQLITNSSEVFAGSFDYTMKDRISFIRFMTMQKVQDISEQWSEGNLELVGRVLVGGRIPTAFTNFPFGSISFPRFAAQLTVPGFADAVEGGYGEICVPKFPFGCRRVNPLMDAFNDFRNSGILFDNRGSSVNSGVWISWNGGTEILSWDAEDMGNRIIVSVKEKDDGGVYTEERSWSVGITPTIGKKDGSNLSFNASVGGKTTVVWTNDDDLVFDDLIDYNGQYGAFKQAVNKGNVEVVFRVY